MPVDPDAVVDAVFRGLQVDEQWAVRTEHGFTWWPSSLRQVVRAEPPQEVLGEDITRVVVEMPLLRGLDGDSTSALTMMGNANAVLSGVVFDPRTGTLCHRLAVSLWDGNVGWLRQLLVHAVAVQQTSIDPDQVDELARLLGGEVDTDVHPRSGPRLEPDEMVNVGAVYAGAGASTVNVPADFARLADAIRWPSPLRTRGMSAGLTLPDGPAWSLSATQHPAFGWGLISLLHVPFGPDVRAGAEAAADLNVADSLEHLSSHFLGGWLHDGKQSLVHHVFTPELVYARDPGPERIARMVNLGMDAVIRARWAAVRLRAGTPRLQ